ncbi:MAG: tetratricopeptide repeat protein [candidate division Zixibacteria bacterium]|nr:tetratricopeptide repeat protein [candidate division Zixibacteria bacterium]
MKISSKLVLLIGIVFTLGLNVSADQTPKAIDKPPDLQTASNADLIRLARQMIRAKDFFRAAGLLESVYERQPDNSTVTNLLRQCYDKQGQFAKSELLIRRLLETSTANFTLHLFLAENLAVQNDTAGAHVAYQQVIDLLADQDPSRYVTTVRSMERYGFATNALDLILTAREQATNPTLMALDAGKILEGLTRYGESSEEYFVALDDSSKIAVEAENRLLNLLSFVGVGSEIETALLRKDGTTLQARAARLLSTHCLKTDRFEEAFRYARLQDSLEENKGHALLRYIRVCQERQLYAEVVKASEEVLSIYGDQSVFEETYFIYADALLHMGLYDRAITVYDTIVAHFPREQDKALACYYVGDIYLNYLNDYQAALAIFDSVSANYRSGNGYMKALLTAPHCLLRQGDLDAAFSKFSSLARRTFNDDIMEAIHFHMGLVQFLQLSFDSSRVTFNRLLVDFPRGFYVNDALSLMLLIDEAKDSPNLLKQYSRFLMFDLQQRPDSGMIMLEELATASDPTLADIALYKLSQISLDQPDSAAAISYVDRLTEQFPESYYLPYGLKIKADILLEKIDSLEAGKEIYRHLLEKYPNYPFISDVRKRLRELEEDTQTS